MTATTSTFRTGHIGLNVTDLDRSLGFYRDLLGFEVLSEGKGRTTASPSSAATDSSRSPSGSRPRAPSPRTAPGCTTSPSPSTRSRR